MTRLLTVELLEALRARWTAHPMPLLERLRPGLTEAEADALVAPLGLRLPDEGRVWWGWHDGVPAGSVRFSRERELGAAGFEYLPLAEAVAEHGKLRRVAEAAAGPGESPDRYWHPAWLPVTISGAGTVVAIDCDVRPGAPSPVRAVDWGARGDDSAAPLAPSFGEMVHLWIEAIDAGRWRWDGAEGRWWSDRTQPERWIV